MSEQADLPLVSVVIPTYNRSQLLRLTVDSVLIQTYPNIEIIVIDDGSTDDTAIVMQQYAGQVTYVKQNNQGGTAASNAGIKLASGKYINVLDHDDLFLPTKIERQVQILNSQPEIGLVHCGYYHIDAEGNLLNQVRLLPEGNVLKDLLTRGNFIWSGAPLIRKECLDKVGYFEDTFSSDWDLWLRIATAGYLFGCIQEPLGGYRLLGGSEMSTSANVSRLEQSGFAILDKVFNDSSLPDDIAALKQQVYSRRHLWLSCMYFATGQGDNGQQHMIDAMALCPRLQEEPEELLKELSEHVLFDVRIGNPVKLVIDLFNHLPPEAEKLGRYRARLLGSVYVEAALRSYDLENIPEAKSHLDKAVASYPAMLKQRDDFAMLLFRHAAWLPDNISFSYVEKVLQNLPANAQSLRQVQGRVIGDLNIIGAFEDYFAARWQPVVGQVLTALRYRPSYLRNRGVVSIFFRSLARLWM